MIYDVRCTQEVLVLREMSTIYDFIYHIVLQIRTYISIYTQLRTLHLHHHMCQDLNSSYWGWPSSQHCWWLRISVQAWRKQISESQLWPGLLLRELPVELSEAPGRQNHHRDDEMTSTKKTSCIFFQGIDSRFFEKKLRFLDFNYFRFQKSGRVSRNFGDISDLWMDFLKFYPIYFHEPWAMANANFSRIKGKMCATNKYPSMSLINQSFSNDFNFWF